MEMETSLPDSVFRTYLNIETRDFKTSYFTEAPMKSFLPPVDWEISYKDFRSMMEVSVFAEPRRGRGRRRGFLRHLAR